jgi:hypothetical protein
MQAKANIIYIIAIVATIVLFAAAPAIHQASACGFGGCCFGGCFTIGGWSTTTWGTFGSGSGFGSGFGGGF